jgi:tryptophanyl-tRNA synthetase
MTSDIVLYKAEVVPVGEDQLPHLEIAREIARRFNTLFGEVFPEPKAKLTNFPLIPGLDGKSKMSKEIEGSMIEIAATPEETRAKIMAAVTDPERKFRKDQGHPEICNIYTLHKYFTPAEVEGIGVECRRAGIGCVDCKKLLAKNMNEALCPLREKRLELAAKPEYIKEVLDDGAARARVIARETMQEVRHKMGLL